MVGNSLDLLKNIGFSDYEARAYPALLQHHPATAYELAKKSNIPSSKIYGVVQRLEHKRMIQSVDIEGKKNYIPLPVEDFIEGQRFEVNQNLDRLKKSLFQEEKKGNDYVWNLKDRKELLNKAKDIIERSKQELLLSIWPQEYKELESLLKKQNEKGIRIAIVHFGDIFNRTGQMFRHPIEDTLFKEKGGRGFALVADSSIALMGTFNDGNQGEASWSKSSGFTSLAEDYIRHDIYIMKIVQRFDKELVETFGENYQSLRDVFSNQP